MTPVVPPTAKELTAAYFAIIAAVHTTDERPAVSVRRLVMLPKDWVGYFLEYSTFRETYK